MKRATWSSLLKLSMRLSELCRCEDEEFSIERIKTLEKGKFAWRMMTGVMFGVMGYTVGFDLELIVYLLFAATLITGMYCDILSMAVPTVVLITGTLLILITRLIIGEALSYLVPSIIFFLCFYVFHVFSKDGFGGADVEIVGVMALALGTFASLSIIYLSCWIALVKYVVKWIWVRVRGGDTHNEKVPFFPYLAFGVILHLISLI